MAGPDHGEALTLAHGDLARGDQVAVPLGPRLIALHNLTMLTELMRSARAAIGAGDFTSWSEAWLQEYRAGHAAAGSAD